MTKEETPKAPPREQRDIDRDEELARQKAVTDALAHLATLTPNEQAGRAADEDA